MKIIYQYQVIYVDDSGRKHLHFCEGPSNVKTIRDRYKVLEVAASKRTFEKKEDFLRHINCKY